ncbi:hypothetical protein D210916BOD24_25560 [Alteromonas sp. D210916BOD_24]
MLWILDLQYHLSCDQKTEKAFHGKELNWIGENVMGTVYYTQNRYIENVDGAQELSGQ